MNFTVWLLQWVCQKSSVMTNTRDKLGRSPLLVALMSGAGRAAVEVLVAEGEMVDMADDVGRSCAEAALLYCNKEVAEVVLRAALKLDKGGNLNKVGVSKIA